MSQTTIIALGSPTRAGFAQRNFPRGHGLLAGIQLVSELAADAHISKNQDQDRCLGPLLCRGLPAAGAQEKSPAVGRGRRGVGASGRLVSVSVRSETDLSRFSAAR